MRKGTWLLLCCALTFAALSGPVRPAEAGIYCSSYDIIYCGFQDCCRETCVYCEDDRTGELLSENCRIVDCWYSGPRVI